MRDEWDKDNDETSETLERESERELLPRSLNKGAARPIGNKDTIRAAIWRPRSLASFIWDF